MLLCLDQLMLDPGGDLLEVLEDKSMEMRGHAELLADLCDRPHRKKRMSAEIEEVVCRADLFEVQKRFPYVSDSHLDRASLQAAGDSRLIQGFLRLRLVLLG